MSIWIDFAFLSSLHPCLFILFLYLPCVYVCVMVCLSAHFVHAYFMHTCARSGTNARMHARTHA